MLELVEGYSSAIEVPESTKLESGGYHDSSLHISVADDEVADDEVADDEVADDDRLEAVVATPVAPFLAPPTATSTGLRAFITR